jgi:nicotinamide mononucleotide transporter
MNFLLPEYHVLIFGVLQWFFASYIEILATTTGLIYLVYSVEQNKLLWVFGLITSLLYIYVFYKAKIYADMGINFYYVIISIYGWIHWTNPGNLKARVLPVNSIKWKTGILLTLLTLILFLLISFVLTEYTDSDIALWDAFTTAASITATWMLARKMLEHWLIWIIVDSISAGLYIIKGLYPTVILFIVYTLLAVFGYIEWRKTWKSEIEIA